MQIRKNGALFAGFCIAMLVAASVQAQPPFGGPGGRGPGHHGPGHGPPFMAGPHAHSPISKLIQGRIGRMLVLKSELDITFEQKRKMFGKVIQHKKEILSAAQQIHNSVGKLKKATHADNAEEAAIRASSK